ncbi:hypothetical protein BDP27DRAFT_1317720 [Rhodocollybia butyracea]|uniref:Zn(2)-C6 fungal-type domain-containing protein n=1 Tax=Rhodocollybia butyracea TaxID=206335 RepID=A0A9P5Q2N8_9AGAR|nr:hypothetical protein BDP27DRAFT_1317720 [Rhodocollybia butyracea]
MSDFEFYNPPTPDPNATEDLGPHIQDRTQRARGRKERACDQCNRKRCKCVKVDGDPTTCRACIESGEGPCTLFRPLLKTGPKQATPLDGRLNIRNFYPSDFESQGTRQIPPVRTHSKYESVMNFEQPSYTNDPTPSNGSTSARASTMAHYYESNQVAYHSPATYNEYEHHNQGFNSENVMGSRVSYPGWNSTDGLIAGSPMPQTHYPHPPTASQSFYENNSTYSQLYDYTNSMFEYN